jgi:hypothetical protein
VDTNPDGQTRTKSEVRFPGTQTVRGTTTLSDPHGRVSTDKYTVRDSVRTVEKSVSTSPDGRTVVKTFDDQARVKKETSTEPSGDSRVTKYNYKR